MTWTKEQINSAIDEVVKRSRIDADFRALALKDAGAALAQVAPGQPPAPLKARFVESAGYDLTIAPPDAPAAGEIDDRQLAAIAGGGYGLGGYAPTELVPGVNIKEK